MVRVWLKLGRWIGAESCIRFWTGHVLFLVRQGILSARYSWVWLTMILNWLRSLKLDGILNGTIGFSNYFSFFRFSCFLMYVRIVVWFPGSNLGIVTSPRIACSTNRKSGNSVVGFWPRRYSSKLTWNWGNSFAEMLQHVRLSAKSSIKELPTPNLSFFKYVNSFLGGILLSTKFFNTRRAAGPPPIKRSEQSIFSRTYNFWFYHSSNYCTFFMFISTKKYQSMLGS